MHVGLSLPNARRPLGILDQYSSVLTESPNIKHRFGDHAIEGERNDIVSLRRWFARLGTVANGLQLTVTEVWVKVSFQLTKWYRKRSTLSRDNMC